MSILDRDPILGAAEADVNFLSVVGSPVVTSFPDGTLTLVSSTSYYAAGTNIIGIDTYPDGGFSMGTEAYDRAPKRVASDGTVDWTNTDLDANSRLLLYRTGKHGVYCTQERLYFTGDTTFFRDLYALSSSTGAQLWNTDTSEGNNAGCLALADDSQSWAFKSSTGTGPIRSYDATGTQTGAYLFGNTDLYGARLVADETHFAATGSDSGAGFRGVYLFEHAALVSGAEASAVWTADVSAVHTQMTNRRETSLSYHDGTFWLTTGTAVSSVFYLSKIDEATGSVDSIALNALTPLTIYRARGSAVDRYGETYVAVTSTAPETDILKFDADGAFKWSAKDDKGLTLSFQAGAIGVDEVDGTIYVSDYDGNAHFITQAA